MGTVKSDNLRAVMFACQKTSDIVNRYEDALEFNFIRFLLCSLIAYACRIKNGKCKKWENNESSPANLGTATFPLYRVCYDYINNQRFDKSKFKESQESYLRQKRYENNKSEFNKWFEELRRFYDNTEENVSKAVGQKMMALMFRNMEC